MPLRTKTIDFEAERERLHEQMSDLAEKQAEMQDSIAEADSDGEARRLQQRAQELLQQGNELNNQRNILAHVADEWDRNEVELAGLTAGEVNRVEDTVEDNPGVRERDAWVAIGTRDAPYVEHDPENVTQDAFEDTVARVTDLPLPYVRWAEAKISELSHVSEAEGNGYLQLVQDKQAGTN